MKVLEFTYTNHRGYTRKRRMIPEEKPMAFAQEGNPPWYLQPCWLVSGIDIDKGVRRSFVLTKMTDIKEVDFSGEVK